MLMTQRPGRRPEQVVHRFCSGLHQMGLGHSGFRIVRLIALGTHVPRGVVVENRHEIADGNFFKPESERARVTVTSLELQELL